jgi:hypothetical protein
MMNRKLSLSLTLIALLTIVLSTGGRALASPSSDGILTGYYNMLGHEGIGTVGIGTMVGQAPPVGDWVSQDPAVNCRYIDVPNTTIDQYFLQYPLHLPNGVTITSVAAYVSDINTNSNGNITMLMMSRPWNSTEFGTQFAFNVTTYGFGNQLATRTGINTLVNNQTTEYWIAITPVNNAYPGDLCVYGIQVTYTYNGAFLPLIMR